MNGHASWSTTGQNRTTGHTVISRLNQVARSSRDYKVEFNQPFYWLYSVPNLLVFQHLVILYLGGFVVKVVSEIEC